MEQKALLSKYVLMQLCDLSIEWKINAWIFDTLIVSESELSDSVALMAGGRLTAWAMVGVPFYSHSLFLMDNSVKLSKYSNIYYIL